MDTNLIIYKARIRTSVFFSLKTDTIESACGVPILVQIRRREVGGQGAAAGGIATGYNVPGDATGHGAPAAVLDDLFF